MPDYTGNNGDNTVNGSNGSDTISGLGGEDTLSGGNGNDTISGGDGDDEIDGGNGDDDLDGGSGEDLLDGGNGDDDLDGGSGEDLLDGGNGDDTIDGGDDDDVIYGGNGGDTLYGGSGDDELYGQNGNDHLTGGAGDDLIDGNNGFDVVYYSGPIEKYSFYAAAGYLHVVHLGGAGTDGHDRLIRVERLVFADRVIEIGSGHNAPVAGDDHVFIAEDAGTYSSGAASVKDNDFDFDGDALTVSGGTFVGTYGTLTLNANGTYSYALNASAQALAQGEDAIDSFNYVVSDNDGSDTGTLVFHLAGANDSPVANPDTDTTSENAVLPVDVLANDTDVDNGAVITLTAASAPAGQGTAAVVGGQVQFDPGSDFESLAVGDSQTVAVSYSIEDEHGASSSSTLTVTVTGTNDGPVANADTATTGENAVLPVDVLANDTDVDNGAVLTVTAASAPAGQGTASVVGNQVEFDPGADFDDLAVGESEVVVVSYLIEDEHGASSSSTVTITVTGTNDGPVANADTATTGENSAVTLDVLANDVDADNQAILTIITASVPAGQGSVAIDEDRIRFDPGSDFSHLAAGETATVVVSYTISDEHGATASSSATVTVEGREEGVSNTGTEGPDVLTGTDGDDTIDALGGDDTVFGLAGDDLIYGGSDADQLYGGEDNDTIEGGSDDDVLVGGEGNDQLLGQAGNDSFAGEDGDDQLSGGDGFDFLSGDAGDDVIEGGNDDDILLGGDGNDELFGQAGNDSFSGDAGDDQLTGGDGNDGLDGGEGDDSLDGGDGDDALTDFSGINSFTGGLGADQITAGSSGGAQTIDAGDGNDTIRHYGRDFASTITTGAGRDTLELLQASIGAAALVVSDFTPGPGGDMVRLSGDEGALLSLLSGWDGSSNPFGSGFLRLQQDGADTLLEWDQDGATGGAVWDTLIVFENTDASAFTDANFVPGFDPDGSALAGQTIIGTNESETLTGTISDDTIDALGGDDTVLGLGGIDLIDGGDGFDFLSGDAGDDVIEGGNDDDILLGGDGNDELFGQAGNDSFAGDAGDDQLSGGDGGDGLDGGEGNDTLEGGDGDDFLVGGSGLDVLTGGAGADIFHFRSGSDGPDEIGDFASGIDRISIWSDGFGGGLFTGGEVSLVSGSDPGSSDATGQFLFDTDDGRLLWDADGTGSGGQVLVATLVGVTSLAASDFVVF